MRTTCSEKLPSLTCVPSRTVLLYETSFSISIALFAFVFFCAPRYNDVRSRRAIIIDCNRNLTVILTIGNDKYVHLLAKLIWLVNSLKEFSLCVTHLHKFSSLRMAVVVGL